MVDPDPTDDATDHDEARPPHAACPRSPAEWHLAEVIDSLPDATFVIDTEKRVVAWNRACEELTGVDREQMLGSRDYAVPFFGARRPVLIDLLDAPAGGPEEAFYKYVERRGSAVYAESYAPALRGGQGAHLWAVASPLVDNEGRRWGAIDITRDVTDLRQVERALRESEARHRALFETAHDAILLMRGDRFIDCNARAVAMYGCATREQVVSTSPLTFSPPTQPDGRPSSEAALDHIGRALAGTPQLFEWEHLRLDGARFAAEVGLNTLQVEGEALLQATVRDITDRRRAEAALREGEEQFRLIMENLADLVAVVDPSGRRLYNSPSYQNILGDVDRLTGSMSFDQIHPEDRQRVRAVFEETVRTGVGQRMEYRMVDRDGQIRHIESQGSVIRGERGEVAKVLVVSRDVTARQQAQERVEASERKYRELVEHANSIILHWTREGRVIFLNEYGQRFFGYSEDEIRGRHVVGTIVPATDSGGRDLASLMEAICANPATFEQNVNENMLRDGRRVWIAWTNKFMWDEHGQVADILSVGTDVTERRRAEEAVRELNATLERRVAERTAELAVARDRAEEADRIKSAFLATMSHELRTPLNSIIGFTGILLQVLAGSLNAEQTKQLGMIQASGRHLLALINDVLDISKIEAGQVEIRCQPFEVALAVRRVAETVSPLAERKALRLATEIGPDVGSISSDQRRVEQILLNLLSNAVKFTEAGQVSLLCEREDDHVVFRVRDSGIGIREEEIPGLFKPFHQIDTGLTRQHEGTGLGLAICKRLAERLGGSIGVESRWGEGSVFTVTLPTRVEAGT